MYSAIAATEGQTTAATAGLHNRWLGSPPLRSMLRPVPNGGMMDTLMFMCDWFRRFGTERLTYQLMHPNMDKVPLYARLTVQLGAVRAHP